MGTRAWGGLVLLLMGVLGANIGLAADWSLVPSLNSKTEYNSNINTTPTGHLSDFIFTLNPSAALNYATEATKLQGTLGISQLLYVKNTGFNHTDQNYQINGQYSLAPRFNVSLNSSFISDSTSQQEFLASGMIITRTPRLSFAVSPGVNYALTERSTAILSYYFNRVIYQPFPNTQVQPFPNTQTQNLQNYSTQLVSLVYQYLLSEKTTLFDTVSATESNYTGITNNYKSLLFSLGVQHNYSANWVFNLAGGLNYSLYASSSQIASFGQFPNFVLVPTQTQKTTNLSPYFNLGATRRWTNLSITGGFSRNQQPSGFGFIAQVNALSLNASYNFTERLIGTLGGGYSLSSESSNTGQNQTNSFNFGSQLTYQITERLTASSGYTFTNQNYGGNNLSSTSSSHVHNVLLMFNYSYPIHHQK